ncbi:MAG: RDD family protein [Candidatus Dormiibacterota bacterium]
MNSTQLDTISVKTSDNVTLGYTVAGLGSRIVAQILDNLVAIPLTFVAALLASAVAGTFVTTSEGATFARAAIGFFAGFVYFGYFFVAEAVTAGKTPGKSAMGLRVIKVDGTAVDLSSVAARNVIRIIDFAVLLIGLVVMFFQPQTRRLGDLAAGTLVVRDGTLITLAAAAAPPPIILRTPDAGPAIDGIERLGKFEHDALRVFLARPGLSESLRASLAGDIAKRLLERLALPPDAPERRWPPELFIERVYLQLDQRHP